MSQKQLTGPLLDDRSLSLAAEILNDIEKVRIANENRLRQLTRSEEDSDGEERGFGLPENHPDVLGVAVMTEALVLLEHDATQELQKRMKRHPLGKWIQRTKGIGLKQGARLLATIGDPYWNMALDKPRTVSALWAYCGLHVMEDGTAARRVKGKSKEDGFNNWSSKAKMRAHLVAESCVKQRSKDCVPDGHPAPSVTYRQVSPPGHEPIVQETIMVAQCTCSVYRVMYDMRRAHTATTHSDWTDGHSHNDALRVVSKAILRDMWREARNYYGEQAQS